MIDRATNMRSAARKRRVFGLTGTLNTASGNAYASFLLGELNATTVVEDSVVATSGRFYTYAFWAQDDFKVTPDLSLNLGLRYDIMKPYTEVYDRWSFMDATTGTSWGPMFAMSVVSLLPVFLGFLLGQRFLVRGIATTGISQGVAHGRDRVIPIHEMDSVITAGRAGWHRARRVFAVHR